MNYELRTTNYSSNAERDTFNFAKRLAATLKGGEVVCLVGDLGSGKTVFTKGLAAGLGVKQIITSPTFVLMKIYQARKHESTKTRKQESTKAQKQESTKAKKQNTEINILVHIDAYRLQNGGDLAAIGVGDYFTNPNCVTVIEWADRVKDILPANRIMLKFKVINDRQRQITIE